MSKIDDGVANGETKIVIDEPVSKSIRVEEATKPHDWARIGALACLLALLLAAPFIFLLSLFVPDQHNVVPTFMTFMEKWFATVSALAGTALGWYFGGSHKAS